MLELRGKNILVTGGAGFIGSHLVDSLITEKPNKLVVVDNLFLGKKENLEWAYQSYPSLIFEKLDASDYAGMKRVIRNNKIEIVYNLAVIPLPTSLLKPKWTVDHNVAITTTLCKLLKENRNIALIHFSSSEAYGTAVDVPMSENHPLHPLTPYAASKAADDYIVMSFRETFGIDAAIIRPFNNYGPRQNDKAYAGVIPIVISKILSGKPIEVYGDGNQTRDFLHVKDTATAAIEIYRKKETRGRIINVASGIETSVNELVNMLIKVLNIKNYQIVHVDSRAGDVRRHCGDITLAKQLIRFNPQVALFDGLKETVDYYIKK